MSDTNPLFDKRTIQAREDTLMRLTPMEGKGSYLVEIIFPLDSMRVYCSKFANPLRVALEAADEALNSLKCEIFNEELNSGKPMTKKAAEPLPYPDMAGAVKIQKEFNHLQEARIARIVGDSEAAKAKDEEKKDGQ